MEIDDFLQEKKAQEAKERLEDAKRKLREEKERAKEEHRKLRDSGKQVHNSEAEEKPAKEAGDYVLKPWMLWNLIILALVAALFIIAMLYPKGSVGLTKDEVLKMIDDKVNPVSSSLDVVKEDVRKLGAVPIDAGSENKELLEEALNQDKDEPIPLKDFTLTIEDTSGNVATGGTIEANGTSINYYVIVKNLEADHLKCKAYKQVGDGDQVEIGYFHIAEVEEEKITESSTTEGTQNLKYSAKCAYAKFQSEKWVETSDFSSLLDAELELILND